MKSPAEIQELADLCEERGDYKRAAKLHDRALRAAEKAYGTKHHKIESYLYNVAMIALATDELNKAKLHFERLLVVSQDPELTDEVPGILESMTEDGPIAVNL